MTEPLCECISWARDYGTSFFTNHHRNCPHYNPEEDAAEIINKLLDAMNIWGSDEDGVHPDCCDQYDRAALSVGRKILDKED